MQSKIALEMTSAQGKRNSRAQKAGLDCMRELAEGGLVTPGLSRLDSASWRSRPEGFFCPVLAATALTDWPADCSPRFAVT